MPKPLVPDRDCGSCNVCCVALSIDEPTLRKTPGIRCSHAQPDNSCGIYDSRPGTCSSYFCGWRLWRWVPQNMRPDQAGVLIRDYQPTAANRDRKPGVAFMTLPGAVINSDALYEALVGAMNARVRLYLEVPGRPGYTAAMLEMTEHLSRPIARRDKAAVLAFLRQAVAQAALLPRDPVMLEAELQAALTRPG